MILTTVGGRVQSATIPHALWDRPDDLLDDLREWGAPDDILGAFAAAARNPEMRKRIAPLPYAGPSSVSEKRVNLLRTYGLDEAEYQRMHAEELNSAPVQAALAEVDRAEHELSTLMYRLNHHEVVEHRRAIAAQWNAVAKGTRTVACRCEWCGRLAPYRHPTSVHCSDECRQRAKDAQPSRRTRAAERHQRRK